MKILKSIYYCFLYFSHKLYPHFKKLDILLIYLNEIGIKSIEIISEYRVLVIFNDNTEFYFWNANRWYAWMDSGHIKFKNGKELEWSNKMPSYETLYKFKKLILKHEKEQKKLNNNNDYYEYLPIKIIRKIKLKNLKKNINL